MWNKPTLRTVPACIAGTWPFTTLAMRPILADRFRRVKKSWCSRPFGWLGLCLFNVWDMGLSINGGTPKWMVCKGFVRENPTNIDDLEVPLFQEPPICWNNRSDANRIEGPSSRKAWKALKSANNNGNSLNCLPKPLQPRLESDNVWQYEIQRARTIFWTVLVKRDCTFRLKITQICYWTFFRIRDINRRSVHCFNDPKVFGAAGTGRFFARAGWNLRFATCWKIQLKQ